MLADMSGWHAVIIVAVIVLFFGAQKLPSLARGLGQSIKIFQSEFSGSKTDKGENTGKTVETDERPTAAPEPVKSTSAPEPVKSTAAPEPVKSTSAPDQASS